MGGGGVVILGCLAHPEPIKLKPVYNLDPLATLRPKRFRVSP